MRKTVNRIFIVTMSLLLVGLLSGVVLAAGSVTIVGTVSDANQLQTENNEGIDIAEGEMGDKLVAETGKKVQVTGTVAEAEGQKTITVESYKVLGE